MSRRNKANTISDGVHASIAPKQIACKVVITPPWVSPPSGKWNFCSKKAFVAAFRVGTADADQRVQRSTAGCCPYLMPSVS
jgi:hypothetical protein